MDIYPSPWKDPVSRRPTAARHTSGGKPRPARYRYAFAAPSLPCGIPSRNFFRRASAAASTTAPGEATSRSASSTRSREKRRDASFHAIFAGPYRRSSWYERASRRHNAASSTRPSSRRRDSTAGISPSATPLRASRRATSPSLKGRRANIPMASFIPPPGGRPASPLRRFDGTALLKIVPREVRGRGDAAHPQREVVGVAGLPERLLEGDEPPLEERQEGLVEGLHPVAHETLRDRLPDLAGLVLVLDVLPHPGGVQQDLRGGNAPLSVGAGEQPLRDDRPEDGGQLQADLLLLERRGRRHDAGDRLGGGHGGQGGPDEGARLAGGARRLSRP